MDWKDDITKFNLPHAKILYMVYFFFKKGDIDYQQKHKLKEYVILENEKIFKVFREFEEGNSMNSLLEGMKNIYNEDFRCSIQDLEPPKQVVNKENVQVKDSNPGGNNNKQKSTPDGKDINMRKSILHNAFDKVNTIKNISEEGQVEEDDTGIAELNSPVGVVSRLCQKNLKQKEKKQSTRSEDKGSTAEPKKKGTSEKRV